MKNKYLKFHPNTSTRLTIKPARLLENMNNKEAEQHEIYKILKQDFESEQDYDFKDNCLLMVRVGRQIRQCRCKRTEDSVLCERHSQEIIFPFGLKNYDNITHIDDLLKIDIDELN
jgi:hypothetical protein